MAQPTNQASFSSTAAFAALLLSLFCTIYVFNSLPAVKDNTEYFQDEISRLQATIDRQTSELDSLRRQVAGLNPAKPLSAEVIALRQALAALESAQAVGNLKVSAAAKHTADEIELLLQEIAALGERNHSHAHSMKPEPTPSPEPLKSETSAAADSSAASTAAAAEEHDHAGH